MQHFGAGYDAGPNTLWNWESDTGSSFMRRLRELERENAALREQIREERQKHEKEMSMLRASTKAALEAAVGPELRNAMAPDWKQIACTWTPKRTDNQDDLCSQQVQSVLNSTNWLPKDDLQGLFSELTSLDAVDDNAVSSLKNLMMGVTRNNWFKYDTGPSAKQYREQLPTQYEHNFVNNGSPSALHSDMLDLSGFTGGRTRPRRRGRRGGRKHGGGRKNQSLADLPEGISDEPTPSSAASPIYTTSKAQMNPSPTYPSSGARGFNFTTIPA